jgi:hypothetical protein
VINGDQQCPDEIVPHKSTSTTLRNTPLTYKHDSAGSFSITGNQLNRVYVRARDYAKLYWSTCSVLFRPDTGDQQHVLLHCTGCDNITSFFEMRAIQTVGVVMGRGWSHSKAVVLKICSLSPGQLPSCVRRVESLRLPLMSTFQTDFL